jgi:ABC-type nitrate/sulfonate/bicarbonate transport system ATPase subunit
MPIPEGARAMRLPHARARSRGDARARAEPRTQQRVSIARAIVHVPRLLLCDEPYTGLDEVGSARSPHALAERRASGAALVLVTHNLSEGLALATHARDHATRQAGALRIAQGEVDATYASEYRELVTLDA